MDGCLNFRDLGGYLTADGKTVKRRTIFRSDSLRDLSDADLARFTELGIRVVHDFRLDHERAANPSRLPKHQTPEVVLLSAGDVPDGGTDIVTLTVNMLEGRAPMAPASFWEDNYVTLLENAGPQFVGLMHSLADSARLPALFHCAGGKDRTGLAATMLLSLLGVAPELVRDDFLLTNQLRTMKRLAFWQPTFDAKGIDPISALPILGVTRAAWERAWQHLDDEYQGPLGYLQKYGLAEETPARLRALLVV